MFLKWSDSVNHRIGRVVRSAFSFQDQVRGRVRPFIQLPMKAVVIFGPSFRHFFGPLSRPRRAQAFSPLPFHPIFSGIRVTRTENRRCFRLPSVEFRFSFSLGDRSRTILAFTRVQSIVGLGKVRLVGLQSSTRSGTILLISSCCVTFVNSRRTRLIILL